MTDSSRLSRRSVLGAAGLAMAGGLATPAAADHDGDTDEFPESCDGPGFDDTPVQPWSGWRFGDACRPRPPAVGPGEPSFGEPPADATVLLGDGVDGDISLDDWTDRDGNEPGWNVTENYAEVDETWLQSRADLGDGHYHVEWRVPADTTGSGQEPGNSGVWLASNYEIQVLHSYDNPTYADGAAGALYGQHPPLVNAARPAGAWQTYDIVWHAPRFTDDGDGDGDGDGDVDADGDVNVATPGVVTVYWNDVLVQSRTVIRGSTPYRAVPEYSPHPPEMPLQLQDHGRPVQFRNVWFRPLPTPRSVVAFDDDQLTVADRTTNAAASVTNASDSELTAVDVTLAPPSDSAVKVRSEEPTEFGALAAGASEQVSWTVVILPAADSVPQLLTASVSYEVGGERRETTYRVPVYPEPAPESTEKAERGKSESERE